MTVIHVVGLDAALSNVGIVEARLVLPERRILVDNLTLIQTEKTASKQVRSSSDDLRRAMEIARALQAPLKRCAFFFSEVPSGAQSARAAKLLGMAVGIIATAGVFAGRQLIEVSPTETKLASVGRKDATKPEMIDWAVARYPNANWLRVAKDKTVGKRAFKKGDLLADNEHLADGVAVIHAGIETPVFAQALAMAGGMMQPV
ncbi:hypothetical protein [Azospirillum argentinense]|uniref:hypothetical protein n=1 Tax=Azospirillum argentinense TaxID=2970906 RepID=UPI0032E00845